MKKTFMSLLLVFSVSEMMAQTQGVNIGGMVDNYANSGKSVAVADYATAGTSDSENYTIVGYGAADSNSDVDNSTYIGWLAGYDGGGTIYNTAVGYKSQYGTSSSDGDYNTSVGTSSLFSYTSGNFNSALGNGTLYSLTTGTNNIAFGSSAGDVITTGSYNTLVGAASDPSSLSATNQTVIGYQAIGQADNSVVLGNDSVTAVYMAEDSGATVYAAGLNLGGVEITSTAAELNLLDGVSTIGDGILGSVTENSNTGVRLSTSNASNHGNIGSNAVDLSYQWASSSTRGATGISSTAMGQVTTASGNSSTAMGYITTASGAYSTVMGEGGTASGSASTAMGRSTTASGYSSTAMGYITIASGYSSTAMGANTTASDYASLVIGQYNSSGSSATSAGSFNTANTAFVIGNGTASNAKSDAFKVMFNGDTTVSNDLTVSGDVVISSDARLKSNIVSLGATLSKLLLIDGKSYEKDGKQRIGVLAQEIQEVFPELVTEDGNEMLAVNYQGLVPVLINALKEQDEKINRLEKLVEKLVENQ